GPLHGPGRCRLLRQWLAASFAQHSSHFRVPLGQSPIESSPAGMVASIDVHGLINQESYHRCVGHGSGSGHHEGGSLSSVRQVWIGAALNKSSHRLRGTLKRREAENRELNGHKKHSRIWIGSGVKEFAHYSRIPQTSPKRRRPHLFQVLRL